MPKISRNKLEVKVYESILNHLVGTLASLAKKEEINDLLDGLFTRTERLMLAKRLAIAALLEQELSYKEISKLLKVSSVTIGFVKNGIMKNNNNYDSLIKTIQKLKL